MQEKMFFIILKADYSIKDLDKISTREPTQAATEPTAEPEIKPAVTPIKI